MSSRAFLPSGTTKLVAASSSTGLAATQVCTASEQGLLLVNGSTAANVYVAFGTSSIAAGCPTTATPAAGLCIPQGKERAYTVPPGAWLSAVTSGATTVSLFATPGFYG